MLKSRRGGAAADSTAARPSPVPRSAITGDFRERSGNRIRQAQSADIIRHADSSDSVDGHRSAACSRHLRVCSRSRDRALIPTFRKTVKRSRWNPKNVVNHSSSSLDQIPANRVISDCVDVHGLPRSAFVPSYQSWIFETCRSLMEMLFAVADVTLELQQLFQDEPPP